MRGGYRAKDVKWQEDFGPINCDRCLEIEKHQKNMQTKMEEIQKAAKDFAAERETLTEIVNTLNHRIEALRLESMRLIRNAVGRCADTRAALSNLIDANRALFDRPRTQVFHGIKCGLRKGTGSVNWEDDAALVTMIREHLPRQFKLLVKVTEKPIAGELKKLDPEQLRCIGAEREDAGDYILIEAADSEVDKIVKALLKGAAKETVESAAA